MSQTGALHNCGSTHPLLLSILILLDAHGRHHAVSVNHWSLQHWTQVTSVLRLFTGWVSFSDVHNYFKIEQNLEMLHVFTAPNRNILEYPSLEYAIATPQSTRVFKAHAIRDAHLEYSRVFNDEHVKYSRRIRKNRSDSNRLFKV